MKTLIIILVTFMLLSVGCVTSAQLGEAVDDTNKLHSKDLQKDTEYIEFDLIGDGTKYLIPKFIEFDVAKWYPLPVQTDSQWYYVTYISDDSLVHYVYDIESNKLLILMYSKYQELSQTFDDLFFWIYDGEKKPRVADEDEALEYLKSKKVWYKKDGVGI